MIKTINWTSWKKWVAALIMLAITFMSWHYTANHTLSFSHTRDTIPSSAITNSQQEEKEIALTFNVSWGDDVIIDILNVLQEEKVQATFFINGEWALRQDDLAQLIVDEQHEVGLLGHALDQYHDQPDKTIIEDLEKGEMVINNLDYEPLRFVRPPEHEYHQHVNDVVQSEGFQMIFWRVFAHVQADSEVDTVVDQLHSDVDPGDILLFFAQDNLTQTPDILKQFIRDKKREGYDFLTVTELLSPADVKWTPLN
ncbi:peptidoglycan/xylan/chitin deacetylase (PgdA/CDA1 family) [Alkalibacillus flavidus]|uniref:Peptidoglycan/xylan/chitin deacetylase (PgdA/CDA1 family) n=1 Tax=Alkalibacillus flavidus TaxID=546021 RepID=A0ABV2KWK7_9BACI